MYTYAVPGLLYLRFSWDKIRSEKDLKVSNLASKPIELRGGKS